MAIHFGVTHWRQHGVDGCANEAQDLKSPVISYSLICASFICCQKAYTYQISICISLMCCPIRMYQPGFTIQITLGVIFKVLRRSRLRFQRADPREEQK